MLSGKFSENYSDKRENISGHAKWSSEWKLYRLILFAVKKIKNQRQFACIITYRMYKCLTFRMCSYKCLKILKTIVTWKLICTLSNFDKNYGCLSGLRAKKPFSLRSQNKFSTLRRTHRTRGQQSRRDSIRNGLQQYFTLK